jgi:hypothetical protein
MSETRDPPPNNPQIGNAPSELRDLIAGIARDSEKPPAGDGSPAPGGAAAGKSDPPPAAAPEPDATGRRGPERSPDGRFRSAAGEPPPPSPEPPLESPGKPAEGPSPDDREKPGEGERPAPAPTAEPEAVGKPAEGKSEGKPAGAPEHWSAGDRAVFNSWGEPVRDQFLAMYRRMEGGFTQKLQRGAQLEREWGDLDQIFTPEQRRLFESQGRKPADLIRTWHQVELGLASKAHQAEYAARILHGYGVDLDRVLDYVGQLRGFAPGGFAPGGFAGQGGRLPVGNDQGPALSATPAPVGNGQDPASGMHPALHARLSALEQDKEARARSDNDRLLGEANRQIEEFANAKDGEGNLQHPFYAELEGRMMQLAYAERLAGRIPVISELYEAALWANPDTRDRELAQRRAAEEKDLAVARQAKAEAARRAGSSITGAPRSGQLPNSGASDGDISIRDQILAARGTGTGRI